MKSRNKIIGLALAAGILPVAVFAVTITDGARITGNLNITGALSKSSGTFVIDHPLRPYTDLLYHSFVESPEAKNVYDGIATLDGSGQVRITLPDYFQALNGDFQYQFFPHYEAMPNLYIKEEVSNNQFVIAGGVPGGVISWQITGDRHDPYIRMYPIIPEVPKTETTDIKRGECIYEELCR